MDSLAILGSLLFISIITQLPFCSIAISCNAPCRSPNDCDGQLVCVNGKCNDDPDVGTHICGGSGGSGGSPTPPNTCASSGTLSCKGHNYPIFRCSPRVTGSTPAKLTNNDFSEGGDGGGPSECDGKYHDNSDRVVALSTGWYNGGSSCGKMIRITAKNGKSVLAKVVDECDSTMGCDHEHDDQPPCKNNIVDASDAVWHALGIDINIGVVDVTWSMA